MKKIINICLLLLLGWCTFVQAQISNRVQNQGVCLNSIIEYPVLISGVNNVAAISTALNYDVSKLEYIGYENISDSLSVGSSYINVSNGRIYFVWSSTREVSIPSDTLVVLRFQAHAAGGSAMTWETSLCEFTSLSGTVQSASYSNATLTVWALPAITSNPASSAIMTTQSTYFQISAGGQGISYRWQKKSPDSEEWVNVNNDGNHSGATSNRLNINNANINMNGNKYRCVVNGTCSPSVTSEAATLTVTDFITITTAVTGTSICPGDQYTIPVRVTNFRNVGGISLALTYDTTRTEYLGHQNIHAALSGSTVHINTYHGVVFITWASATGASIGTGTETLLELNFRSRVSGSTAFNWQTANCEYSQLSGDAFPVVFNNCTSNIYATPAVTSQPTDRTVNVGQGTEFAINASGQGITYRWQVSTDGGTQWNDISNNDIYSNVTARNLRLNNLPAYMEGFKYRCHVMGTCTPDVYSNAATLHLILPTIATTFSGTGSFCPGQSFALAVNVTNCNDIGAISLTLTYDTAHLTFAGVSNVNSLLSTNNVFVNNNQNKLYITWSSPTGVTIGSGSLLSLNFTGRTGTGTLTWDSQQSGACEYSTIQGQIVSASFSNASVSILAQPSITAQAADRSIYEQQSTTFAITATGSGLSYQWQILDNGVWSNLANGGHYANVTTREMRVSNTDLSMSGTEYRCVVVGQCGGTAISNSATLSVGVAPQVVTITAGNVSASCSGTISQPIVATNMNNVAAFSLILNYDTTMLRYMNNIRNIHPSISSGSFVSNNTSNGKIYLTWASATPANFNGDTLFCIDFDCSGGSTTTSWTTAQCEVVDGDGLPYQTNYRNGTIRIDQNIFFDDLDYSNMEAITPTLALAQRGIVTGYNCRVRPNDPITRSELAKIAYLGLFGGNQTLASDYFPSPFLDMQNTQTYYYKYAKALSYLEYQDGVAPFDRNKMNFNPNGTIERIFVLKVLLETFNIAPEENGTTSYTDVPTTLQHYGYVNAARRLGIIPIGQTFRPTEPCTRIEAFNMLYALMEALSTFPTINNTTDLATSDFFIPGNYTPYNFTSMLGIEVGNFSHTTNTSFDIPGRGISLNFSHTYQSFLTELPDEIFAITPLGTGWTHSYNSYIINTDEILDDYGNVMSVPALIVFWPEGATHVYDNASDPTHPKAITKGVYNEITKVSSTQYAIKLKDQTIYTYEKINGSASNAPYMLTSIKDRHDNTTTLSYAIGVNEMPRLTTVTDATNRSLHITYKTGTNHIATVSDPINRTVTFEIEGDNLVYFKNANGDKTFYYYNNTNHYYAHLLDSIRLPKGNTITNVYEQRKLVSTKNNSSICNCSSSSTSISYQPSFASSNNVFLTTTVQEVINGALNISTEYQFNKDGQNTHISSGANENMDIYFENSNDPTLITKIVDRKTNISNQYQYDERGNLIKEIKTGGSLNITAEYAYNSQNDLTWAKDANGNETSYIYSNGSLIMIKDALSNATYLDYNSYGELTHITDPSNQEVSFGYDAHGNRNEITIPALGMSSRKNFDNASRLVSITDFAGNSHTFTYDNCDNLIDETDALGYHIRYRYDKNNNLLATYNQKGDSTVNTYDFNNDFLLSRTFQGDTRSYTYNEDGSIKSYTTANGIVLNMTYDNDGRILNDGYSTYSYNNAGNIQSITKDGKAISYEYDALNRISKVTYDNKAIGYSYDNYGNITVIIYPNNKKVEYTYDALNNLVEVRDWYGNITRYDYQSNGLLSTITYPNKVIVKLTYDGAGRMTGRLIARNQGQGAKIAEYQYTLDKVGNHISENIFEPFLEAPVVAKPNVQYTYNRSNRLLSDGTSNYQYDHEGNLTSKGNINYSFDAGNNLIQCVAGSNIFQYTYDALENRRSRIKNGSITKYAIDINGKHNVIAEYNSSGNDQCYYVYGIGLISRIKSNGETSYYMFDGRGNTVAITDATIEANTTHRYSYDDFGNIRGAEESDYNPYRFLGEYGVTYEDSDLYFMHARYFDPIIGRYISEDPIWSTNLYPYSNNNPMTYIDPDGEYCVDLYNKIEKYNSILNNSKISKLKAKIVINKRKRTAEKYFNKCTTYGFGATGSIAGVGFSKKAKADGAYVNRYSSTDLNLWKSDKKAQISNWKAWKEANTPHSTIEYNTSTKKSKSASQNPYANEYSLF